MYSYFNHRWELDLVYNLITNERSYPIVEDVGGIVQK